MRKGLLIAATAAMPCFAWADLSVSVQVPGVSISFGDRDYRGYYWDGGYWRSPVWWSSHYPRYVVVPRERVYYPGHYWRDHDDYRRVRYYYGGRPIPPQGYYFCPPGQGKKGRC